MTELDRIPINALPDRYSIDRSNVYSRLSGLEAKGYSMAREKWKGKAYINAEQLRIMDALDNLIKNGKDISDFPAPQTGLSYETTGQARLSYDKQDDIVNPTYEDELVKVSYEQAGQTGLSYDKRDELINLLVERIAPPQPVDPLLPQRQLQEIADRSWTVSTSQLQQILGVAPSEGVRLGFQFEKAGRSGREMGWRVNRPSSG